MKSKIFFVMLLCMIFLAGTVAAAEWDNVKSYDPNTRTATIKNLFGLTNIAEVQLLTPLNVEVPAGYQKVAEFRIKGFSDYKDFIKEIELYDLKNGKEKISRSFDLKYRTYEQVEVNDYAESCNNETGIESCNKILTGSHTETKEKWIKLTPADLKKNEELVIGIFTDVKIGDYVDWIPNFAGVKVPEWATWTYNGQFSIGAATSMIGIVYDGSTFWSEDYGAQQAHNFFGNGTYIGSFNTNHNGNNFGITFQGGYLWVTSYTASVVEKWTTAGSYVSEFSTAASGNARPRDITTDGTYWYITDDADALIYKYNLAGTYQSNFDVSGQITTPEGISYDFNNGHLYVMDRTNGTAVFEYQTDGTYVDWFELDTDLGTSNKGIVILNETVEGADVYATNFSTFVTSFIRSSDSAPTVTAQDPANNSQYTTAPQTINFICYGEDDVNFTEMDFYLNGSLTQTNSSGLNATNYTFSETLNDGDYNWSCTGYDNATQSTSTATRYLIIDSVSPSFVVNSPTADAITYSLPYNASLNVSTADAHLDTCWYYTSDSATNITYPCNSLANVTFNTGGSKTIYIWANDTLGTTAGTSATFYLNYIVPEINYTTPVIEGESNTVYFNITANSITSTSANITYNGTDYAMTLNSNNGTLAQFSRSVTAPLVATNTNINLSINYSVNGINNATSNYSQLIYNIPELNVTTTPCSDLALNFSLVDEGNLSAVSGNFQYNFKYGTPNNNTFISQYGEISSANKFYVCVNNSLSNYNWELGEGQVFYTSTSYVDRRYYLFEGTNLSSGARNITLFDLISTDQTSFKLEVEDTSLNPYTDKFTTLVRWYPDLNQYNVVDMGLTDETGSTVIHVRTEDVDYRIGVYEKNGSLIKLAEPIRMVCLVSPCTYTLKISPTEADYTSFLDIDYTFTYNETTGIWTFTFSDSTQKTSEINLTVYKVTGTSVYPVCTDAISAYSGAVTCNTSAYSGTLKGVVLRSASPPVTLAEKIIETTTSAFRSSFGLWISLLIALPIVFIFAFMSPIGAVVGGVIALIPSLYFGAIGWVIMGGIAVLAGIVMHFLKRIG